MTPGGLGLSAGSGAPQHQRQSPRKVQAQCVGFSDAILHEIFRLSNFIKQTRNYNPFCRQQPHVSVGGLACRPVFHNGHPLVTDVKEPETKREHSRGDN